MMKDKPLVLGVDFGTDSVRSVLLGAQDGEELASSLYIYPRWRDGLFCKPHINQFRQHPLDYMEGLDFTVRECLHRAGNSQVRNRVIGLSVDTTGSTPVAVDRFGVPLALLPGMEQNPNAMFVLWKDHTSVLEAAEINEHAKKFSTDYLKFVGGIYSSEWFWAKLIHILRTDEIVLKQCFTWVEHCDWIPFLLTGGTNALDIKRGRCSAGHKALWAEEFGGLPPNEFFSSLDPRLEGFTKRLFSQTYTSDQKAGYLSSEWAQKLGLSTQVVIGIGAFDAHMGAVGGGIEPYHLSKVMGTSTCDILVAPVKEMEGKWVKGICGQVNGSVIPGMVGLEAGQSAFGDTYSWFKNLISWPLENLLKESSLISPEIYKDLLLEISDNIIPELSRVAQALPLEIDSELAIDWLNGRRTPDADQSLKAAIMGLSLGTDAPKMFRTLAESTCFGAKRIVNRFLEEGIPVKGLIGIGGVAKKSPYIMQMMADSLEMPIRIHQFNQTCALGAAMFASVAAGVYSKVEEAMEAMGKGFEVEYKPRKAFSVIYQKRFIQFNLLGDFISKKN